MRQIDIEGIPGERRLLSRYGDRGIWDCVLDLLVIAVRDC